PAPPVASGQRPPGREVLQRSSLGRPVAVEPAVAFEAPPGQLERFQLEPVDRVPVDPPDPAQRAARIRQAVEPGAHPSGPRNLFNPDVKRIPKAPAARVVRAWLLWLAWRRSVERVEEQQLRAPAARPAGQAAEGGKVA